MVGRYRNTLKDSVRILVRSYYDFQVPKDIGTIQPHPIVEANKAKARKLNRDENIPATDLLCLHQPDSDHRLVRFRVMFIEAGD
jgi:hypothetical protein